MIPTLDLANSLLGGGVATSALSHRYWRVNSIDVAAGGSFLEISELNLFEDAIDMTSVATVTSSTPPTGASLPELVDNDTGTRCNWTTLVAEDPGFWIKFDFGAGNDKAINGVKQGGWDTSDRFMEGFSLQWSDNDSSWTTLGSKTGLTYPGNNTLSSLYTFP